MQASNVSFFNNLLCLLFLNSSMVERTAVNRDVVGSSPTWGAFLSYLYINIDNLKFFLHGSVVKRLRHRPFTAVTWVRTPSESLGFYLIK